MCLAKRRTIGICFRHICFCRPLIGIFWFMCKFYKCDCFHEAQNDTLGVYIFGLIILARLYIMSINNFNSLLPKVVITKLSLKIFMFFISFFRSFLYSSTFWMAYDFQWQTPLFGMTTGAANLILACVSLDRFIYLRRMGNGTPKFCRRIVARHMIVASILISIVVNMPYFFVFVVKSDGSFETTDFYFSK